MTQRIVPIEVPRTRTGTDERRQPESNRWGVPVGFVKALALGALFIALFLGPLVVVDAFAKCQTKSCWQRVREARAAAWLKRERPAVYWWRAQAPGWKAWARSTGECESHNNPRTATGNGFYGAFQFTPSTWYAAQGYAPRALHTRRMPHQLRWEHQAVVAIALARAESTRHWPVCGR